MNRTIWLWAPPPPSWRAATRCCPGRATKSRRLTAAAWFGSTPAREEMRRFVMVLGGNVAAPSQMRIVHNRNALNDCAARSREQEAARDETAVKGETRLLRQEPGRNDEAWPSGAASDLDERLVGRARRHAGRRASSLIRFDVFRGT